MEMAFERGRCNKLIKEDKAEDADPIVLWNFCDHVSQRFWKEEKKTKPEPKGT